MVSIIIPDETKTPPPAGGKEGIGYDRCPVDACLEVDTTWHDGDPKTGQLGERFLYSADRRQGGCGTAWARTDTHAAAQDQSKDIDPKWKTRGAGSARRIFAPTEAYRNAYERIFGHE